MAAKDTVTQVRALEADKYKYGFVTDIEQDFAPKGLNEDTVRFISAKKGEPAWMLEWRLGAFKRCVTLLKIEKTVPDQYGEPVLEVVQE